MNHFVHWTLHKIHLYVAHAQHFFYYTCETGFVNTFPAGTFCLVSHVFTISFSSMHIFALCFIYFFYFFFYSVLFFCHFSFSDPNFFMTKYAVFFFQSPPPLKRVARDAGCNPLVPDSVSRRPRLSLRSSHYCTWLVTLAPWRGYFFSLLFEWILIFLYT